MNQILEQENNSMTTINSNGCTVFEHLSNEIIYEIFYYLDTYEVYVTLSKLNIRFRNLLTSSKLPIKINTSNISKSSFEQYYQQFIIHNTHRISSLYLSNSFIVNIVLPSLEDIIKFIRLEKLYLDNIDLTDREDLLDDLAALPKLSSLVINSVTNFYDKNSLYRQLFRLPTLKYCKLSLGDGQPCQPLSIAFQNFSSIEYLVINDGVNINQLIPLLSYTPQLRHLSIKCLVYSYGHQPDMFSIVLNNLTHVSVELKHIKFDQFEPFIRNLFHHLHVLHISTSGDNEYLNAERWERVILSHMPHLRIFDIQYKIFLIDNRTNETVWQGLMNSFATSFWTERKWFFTHRHIHSRYPTHGDFYSIQPYRRKSYILNSSQKQCGSLCHIGNRLDLVRHIHIQNELAAIDGSIHFPNATELTISDNFYLSDYLTKSNASGIVSLSKLTKITFDTGQIYFTNIIKMLCLTPNCNKLMLSSILLNDVDPLSLQCSESFRFLSNTNNITDITVKSCTFEGVQLLTNLCPRLQHLTIRVLQEEFQSIVKYLLMNNENTRHLHSLHIQSKGDIWVEKLMNTISEVKKHGEVSVKVVGYFNCYLWW